MREHARRPRTDRSESTNLLRTVDLQNILENPDQQQIIEDIFSVWQELARSSNSPAIAAEFFTSYLRENFADLNRRWESRDPVEVVDQVEMMELRRRNSREAGHFNGESDNEAEAEAEYSDHEGILNYNFSRVPVRNILPRSPPSTPILASALDRLRVTQNRRSNSIASTLRQSSNQDSLIPRPINQLNFQQVATVITESTFSYAPISPNGSDLENVIDADSNGKSSNFMVVFSEPIDKNNEVPMTNDYVTTSSHDCLYNQVYFDLPFR